MSSSSKIEWTDSSWNPIRGCSRVSHGCGGPGDQGGCCAEGIAARFSGHGKPYAGLAKMVTLPSGKRVGRWTGEVAFVEHLLTLPLRWKKPQRIFVNSMSDLFHEKVPDEWIDRIFAVMALCPQHTFQVLTKRPERMRAWFAERWQPAPTRHFEWPGGDKIDLPAEIEGEDRHDQVLAACEEFMRAFKLADTENDAHWTADEKPKCKQFAWPLPNVWLGVSVEDQATADERIPLLLQTPAAIRFVSYEPALGPVDFKRINPYRTPGYDHWTDALRGTTTMWNVERAGGWGGVAPAKLDWIIAGGESGKAARPAHPDWFRSVKEQCNAAGVAFFMKQITERGKKQPIESWPIDLYVREFPNAA